MTKFSIAVLLCMSSFTLQAQSLDDVNKLLEQKKLPEAKAAIDKHIADPKNSAKADAWYYEAGYTILCLTKKHCLKQNATTSKCRLMMLSKKRRNSITKTSG